MSFSSEVKKELAGHVSSAMHCRIAELAAIISMCGNVTIDVEGNYSIRIKTETGPTAEKTRTLLWKTFHIDTEIVARNNVYSKTQATYTVSIKDNEQALKVLQATKLINSTGDIEENFSITNNVIVMKDCCKRAFIRGAFTGLAGDFRLISVQCLMIICMVQGLPKIITASAALSMP